MSAGASKGMKEVTFWRQFNVAVATVGQEAGRLAICAWSEYQ
jgi:hypothetical protein